MRTIDAQLLARTITLSIARAFWTKDNGTKEIRSENWLLKFFVFKYPIDIAGDNCIFIAIRSVIG